MMRRMITLMLVEDFKVFSTSKVDTETIDRHCKHAWMTGKERHSTPIDRTDPHRSVCEWRHVTDESADHRIDDICFCFSFNG